MKLDDPGGIIISSSGRFGSIYTFLSEFTSLTSLHVRNQFGEGLPQLSLFHVLRLCPNLIKLNWESSYREPIIDESIYSLDHCNLKELDIILRELTTEHIDCIAKNITDLARLSISINFKNYFQSTENIYLHPILQLYLSRIDSVDLVVRKDYIPTTIDLWLFLNGIIGNIPPTSTHISMTVFRLINKPSRDQIQL